MEYLKKEKFGYSISYKNVKDIIKKIHLINNNYKQISENAREASKVFNWNDVSKDYKKIY